MTTSSPVTVTRTSDSSTQTPTIAARGTPTHQAKPAAGRSDGFARRFVAALMRSLAAPHV